MSPATDRDESFELYDLKVVVCCPVGKRILCGAKDGDYFTLQGEMLYLPPGQGISLYSLGMLSPRASNSIANAEVAAVLPLLPAKQRVTHKNDWMTTDALIACPDPNCASQLKIVREGLRTFNHGETTVVPLG